MVDPMFPFGNVGLSLLEDTMPPIRAVDVLTNGVYPVQESSTTQEKPNMAEVTVPAAELDWSHVKASTATRLRKPKVTPVPPHIVGLAQASWDDKEIKEHDFGESEQAQARAMAFAKLLKKAGEHTSPMTTVEVAIDPEEEGRAGYVRWRAGNRRGRGTAQGVGALESEPRAEDHKVLHGHVTQPPHVISS